MKKHLILISFSIIAFLFQIERSNAQIGVGGQLGLFNPLGDNSGDAHFGFNLNGKYDLDDQMRVGLNIGHYFKRETTTFFGTTYTMTTSFTPITALFEYSFLEGEFDPYGGVDLGLYRAGVKVNNNSNSSGHFGLAPTAGMRYELSSALLLDGGIKYHLIFNEGNTTSALGINFGVLYYL